MIILAIDPGSKQSGWVRWDTSRNVVLGASISPNSDVRTMVSQCIGREEVAIEVIRGYGIVAGDDTFDTCIWIGRFDPDENAMLIPRKDIKRHLCGNTTTNDKYVRQALIDRLGEQGTKKAPGPLFGIAGHMWAALAVAVCAADRLLNNEKLSGTGHGHKQQ